MKNTLFAGFGLTALVLAGTGLVGAPAAWGEDELDGKAQFMTHKCNLCHGVPAVEIEAETKSDKMKGADLGGPVEIKFEKLAGYVRGKGDLNGKKHKKEFKGTDEELQAIIDWLGSLEAQE